MASLENFAYASKEDKTFQDGKQLKDAFLTDANNLDIMSAIQELQSNLNYKIKKTSISRVYRNVFEQAVGDNH